jgi:hypothetical protein
MHRHLIAALAAAAMLPFAALDAVGAPVMATQFGKTYRLYCAARGTERIYVENRTAPAIKAGSDLQIVLWTYNSGKIFKTVTAPRTLIGIFGANFEFPPETIRMCEAYVTLRPNIGIRPKKPAG